MGTVVVRRLTVRTIALSCAGLIALGTSACGAAVPGPESGPESGEWSMVVEAGVVEALRADGSVNVVVALVAPDGVAADTIARWQDEVLDELEPADFRLGHRFDSVPALAGTVLSERGLAVLRAHPRVARVGLDAGGGGDGAWREDG